MAHQIGGLVEASGEQTHQLVVRGQENPWNLVEEERRAESGTLDAPQHGPTRLRRKPPEPFAHTERGVLMQIGMPGSHHRNAQPMPQ